ncbi:PREDICTED: MAM and LDL-receptor class A domain-containing protein 1-like [Branchiostoma belcheri]|uniref:MAM and LDL-receptor class A domain-containing protein 1-like n=1 Tax=Branchiostoma belcheri TaxID=7741 RepID=A0A6P4Z0Q6_BRABE|nr:PREDICTED: MAM and LDL-receptor class A domain-containing protein 1-like [Branchiostoma belcheri]
MEYGILRQDGRMTGTKMQMYRFLLTLAAVATAEYAGWYVMSSCGGAVQPGNVATITSPDIIGPCTLEFWYTMFGVDLDMSVYLLQRGQKTQIWHMADVNEDFWQQASITLSPPMEGAYQVVFESVKGTNFLCNVAFDDVKLAPAPLLKCDFESTGPCALRQDVSDVFDWRWQQGMTDTREDVLNRNLTAIAPDLLTGPEYDVTIGPDGNGTYMYVESSVQSAGHHARLSSTELSGQCLEFYFHMTGRHSGTLKVYQQSVYENDTTEQLIWEVSGSHGDVWHRAAVSLNITNNFYIRFEAEVGGYYSNIAIDEVRTLDQPCTLAGGWGAWEDWTECDAECDGGTQSRAAYCENPYPVFGHFCEGDDDGDMKRVEVRTCNTQPCPTTAVPTTPPKTTSETTVETTTVTTPEPTTTAQTTTMETTTMTTTIETTLETTTETTIVTTPEPTTTEEPTTTPMATTTEEPTTTEPEVTTEAELTTVEETTTDVITTTEEVTTPEVTTEQPTTTTTTTTATTTTTGAITTDQPTTLPTTTTKTTTTKTTTTPKPTTVSTTTTKPATTTTTTTPPPKPDATPGKPVTQKPAPPQKTDKPGEFANLQGGEAAKSSNTGMVVGVVCGLLALLLLLLAIILFIRKKKQKSAGRVSPSPEESELQPPPPRRHQWEAPDSEA